MRYPQRRRFLAAIKQARPNNRILCSMCKYFIVDKDPECNTAEIACDHPIPAISGKKNGDVYLNNYVFLNNFENDFDCWGFQPNTKANELVATRSRDVPPEDDALFLDARRKYLRIDRVE